MELINYIKRENSKLMELLEEESKAESEGSDELSNIDLNEGETLGLEQLSIMKKDRQSFFIKLFNLIL